MKQIIYSTGYFETSLTIEHPAEMPDYNAPYEVIFSADTVYMCIEDEKAKCFGAPAGLTTLQIFDASLFKSRYSQQYLTNYHINKFRDMCHVANCIVCDCENPVNLQLKVFTYKELCGILRIKREQLPFTFQNYISDHST